MEKKWNWTPFGWVTEVGCNPESADYTNPRGAIYGERYFPCAEAKDGSRYVSWHRPCDTIDECLEDCSYYNYYNLCPNPKVDALEQPTYGSEAYQREGWEEAEAFRDSQETVYDNY